MRGSNIKKKYLRKLFGLIFINIIGLIEILQIFRSVEKSLVLFVETTSQFSLTNLSNYFMVTLHRGLAYIDGSRAVVV